MQLTMQKHQKIRQKQLMYAWEKVEGNEKEESIGIIIGA